MHFLVSPCSIKSDIVSNHETGLCWLTLMTHILILYFFCLLEMHSSWNSSLSWAADVNVCSLSKTVQVISVKMVTTSFLYGEIMICLNFY